MPLLCGPNVYAWPCVPNAFVILYKILSLAYIALNNQ